MGDNPLRELLNRLRWDPGCDASSVSISVLGREGGAEVVERVPFAAVSVVGAAGLTVTDGTFLPYHRIIKITRGSEVLWLARGEESR